MRDGAVQDLFRHLNMPPELACEFLAVFSRLEYALKVSGFATGGEGKVDPAWDIFANAINGAFLESVEGDVVDARDFLLQHPPRKQVLRDGRVEFADQVVDPAQRRTQQLLLMVRTVRNNLFHGGKYLPDGEQESGRNERLVRCGLVVLRACSTLNDGVRLNFQH